jgi:quercetin dioxygenase-like cupin family protein
MELAYAWVMKRFPFHDASSPEAVQRLVELHTATRAALQVGSVRLEPGQRVPDEGASQHPVDEVSLVVKGSLTATSGGESCVLRAGEVSLIPAGEPHWAVAGEEGAEIFWLHFGAARTFDE